MAKRTVIVNDKMQKRYRYARTAPLGRGFDPEFKLIMRSEHLRDDGTGGPRSAS